MVTQRYTGEHPRPGVAVSRPSAPVLLAWKDRGVDQSMRKQQPEHPWRGIGLDVYERHMSDARVGQLQRLREITGEQLAAYPGRAVGVLGVAGGNGLDLIDPQAVEAVYGYDINPDYLLACEGRYRAVFGDRLHLVEATIDRDLTIQRVDLLIANLIVEYVGGEEFAAFAAANAARIGLVSCVIQFNDAQGFVSSTPDASAFDGLATVASDVEPDALAALMSAVEFACVGSGEYPLPNGKTLVRLDFRPASAP
jgi:hypothetical protein